MVSDHGPIEARERISRKCSSRCLPWSLTTAPLKRKANSGTWVTTEGFLDHFSLESLRDLPGVDELKATGLLDKRPAIQTLTQSDEPEEEEADDGDDQTGSLF